MRGAAASSPEMRDAAASSLEMRGSTATYGVNDSLELQHIALPYALEDKQNEDPSFETALLRETMKKIIVLLLN
uniref:Uncharacterized protein n=1 Tax=Meloidogyne hapla TaxID=6305 RepID=A0A1I8AXQ7_MELHA